MRARLLRGVGANLYAQGVTTLIQIAAVPVLLGLWGPSRYGLWALASAIPAALAFADGGLVIATATAMTMAVARRDTGTAAALFRRAVRTVALAVSTIGCAAAVVGRCLPAHALGGATGLLLPFALTTLTGVLGTLPGAAFRADGRYAAGVALAATLRALETAAVLAAAALPAGLEGAAWAWMAARVLGTAMQFAIAWLLVPWLRRPAASAALAPLLRPALAAVALPAAFALSLQGTTVAVGLVLPAEAVAGFTAARTLARLIVQGAGLVNHALMPEMSRVAGRRDGVAAAGLLRLSRTAAAALLVPGWLALLGLGPQVFAAWTGGRLPLAPAVLPVLATAALLHGLWLARANLLLAVNRQADFAWAFLAAAALTAGLAAICGRAGGPAGAAAATLACEVAMALWVLRVVRGDRRGPDLLPGAARP